MPILPDPYRDFPNSEDDAAMDAAEASWIAERELLDAIAEEHRIDAECLKEAARVARLDADAAVAEAERLEAMVEQTTAARIAMGNAHIMDAITATLARRSS